MPQNFGPHIIKSKGIDIWDLENNRYKDLSIMGVGTNILGYANDEVDDEVVKNIKRQYVHTQLLRRGSFGREIIGYK